jgi:hypothetical protein
MYNYSEQRKNVFTEEGQKMFLKIRDRAHKLLNEAGAFMLGNVISGVCGSSWDMLACVDRLVELGEIREITQKGVAGQHRVFVKGKQ